MPFGENVPAYRINLIAGSRKIAGISSITLAICSDSNIFVITIQDNRGLFGQSRCSISYFLITKENDKNNPPSRNQTNLLHSLLPFLSRIQTLNPLVIFEYQCNIYKSCLCCFIICCGIRKIYRFVESYET